jgi:hypothetical protein
MFVNEDLRKALSALATLTTQVIAMNADLEAAKADIRAMTFSLDNALERIQQLEAKQDRPRTHFSK